MHAKQTLTCMDADKPGQEQTQIMVCQSDAYLAGLLNMLLRREGYCLTTVTQPARTAHWLDSSTPAHMILLDGDWIRHDESNIIETIRSHASWRHVPIIVLMKYYRSESIGYAMEAGATDYIIQPFDPVELMGQIQRHRVTLQ